MASDQQVKQLTDLIKQFKSLNFDSAFKKNLGDQSLSSIFSSRISEITNHLDRAISVATEINESAARALYNAIISAVQQIGPMTGVDPAGFIQNRSQFQGATSGVLDGIENALFPFRVLLQEKALRSLLEPDQAALSSTKEALKAETEQIIRNVRHESEAVLAEAKRQAISIHATARETASGVSLITAQDHFATLLSNFKVGAVVSGIVSLASFSAFFGYAVYLLYHPPEVANYPAAVFSIAIRVTVLGSLATVVGIALKIFRSNLHLLYHTLHRRQLTNSIPTFVDAARTDEQRDLIFAKLVESVSSFGNSGLIDGADEVTGTAKIIVDTLPKLLGARGSKE